MPTVIRSFVPFDTSLSPKRMRALPDDHFDRLARLLDLEAEAERQQALRPTDDGEGRALTGLVIRDDYTSTHHARLLLWNDEWMIQDLDSTNGTFLDGRRVTVPTQVPLDTPIKIGTTTFELRR